MVTDQVGDRRLALKLIDPVDSAADARLRAEFRRLGELSHPCLLDVLDLARVEHGAAGFPRGALFFTADYLPGEDLHGFAAGRPGAAVLLRALEDVSAALEVVHVAGLLHCDIKPDNIRITDSGAGSAVLLDLGLSVSRGVQGLARGTPAYMDRRALAGAPDIQSDIHALGAAFYAALSGAPPFPHGDIGQLVAALERGQPALLARWCPDLDPELAALIDRMLLDSTRPSSASVVLDSIAQLREALGLAPSDRPARPAAGVAIATPRLIGRESPTAEITEAIAARDRSRGAAPDPSDR